MTWRLCGSHGGAPTQIYRCDGRRNEFAASYRQPAGACNRYYGTFETPDFQRQSRDFAAAVKAAGKPVQLIEAPNYAHIEMVESLGIPMVQTAVQLSQ